MRILCSSIAVIVCFLGCGKSGPPIAPVSGTVSLDGAPLTDGVVSFVSTSGYVSSAPLGLDGHFRLVSQYGDGIPLGTYRVTILLQNPEPNEMSMQSKRIALPSKIPVRYQYPDRSGLTASIEGQSCELSFELSTDPT